MKEQRISFCQGNGSLECNNRETGLKNKQGQDIQNSLLQALNKMGYGIVGDI